MGDCLPVDYSRLSPLCSSWRDRLAIRGLKAGKRPAKLALYSFVLAAVVASSPCAGKTSIGGGFGATKIYRSGGKLFGGMYLAISDPTVTVVTGNSARANASPSLSAVPLCWLARKCNPNTVPEGKKFDPPVMWPTPESTNICAISLPYEKASGSPVCHSMSTWRRFAISSALIASPSRRYCSGETCRQAVSFSISAARSRACAADWTANASVSFERLRSSVWMRLFQIVPSPISPVMPMATAASANVESFKNKRYAGSAHEIKNSATTAIITRAANHTPHHSHDDDAPSNSWFEAFIVPFGSHHAGNNTFRVFLIAMAVWSLVLGLLFMGIWLWQ